MTSGPITKEVSAWAVGLMQIRIGASAANIATITPVLTSANSIGALSATKFLGTTEFFEQMSGFPKTKDGSIPLSEIAALEIGFKELTPYNMALARGIDPTASQAVQVIEDVNTVTSSGTTTGDISVASTAGWGVIDEMWTVIFTAATTGIIVGKATGHVHDFANVTSAMEPVDGSSDKYFSIPANFFSGTWAADETYVFYTLAGGASTYASAHSGNIGFGGMVAPSDVRVEALYTYPNGTNTMTYIFPRGQAVASIEVDHAEESEVAVPISFQSGNASSNNSLGNVVWDAMPLGRVIWA